MVSYSYRKIGLLAITIGFFGAAVYALNQKTIDTAENTVLDKTTSVAMIDKLTVFTVKDKINRAGLSKSLSFPVELEIPQSETAAVKYQPYFPKNNGERTRVSTNFSAYSRSLLKSNLKVGTKTYLDKKRRSGDGFIALISPDELIRTHTNQIKMQALERQWVQRTQDGSFDPFASTELAIAQRVMREKSNQLLEEYSEYAEYDRDAGSYLGGLLAHLKKEKHDQLEHNLVARAKNNVKKKSKYKVVFRNGDTSDESLDKIHQNATQKLIAGGKKIRRASKSLALAYAPAKKKSDAPFGKVIVDGSRTAKLDTNKGDHAWVNNALPKRVSSSSEQKCLSSGIYFEARGETEHGMAAVAQVILNRVKNPAYPRTICGVVYQNKHMRNRCQFSFACDGIPDLVLSPSAWRQAKRVAKQSVTGKLWIKEVGSSTHYHATYVRPRWARTMKRMKKIGLHIFYRTYGGGWS